MNFLINQSFKQPVMSLMSDYLNKNSGHMMLDHQSKGCEFNLQLSQGP